MFVSVQSSVLLGVLCSNLHINFLASVTSVLLSSNSKSPEVSFILPGVLVMGYHEFFALAFAFFQKVSCPLLLLVEKKSFSLASLRFLS